MPFFSVFVRVNRMRGRIASGVNENTGKDGRTMDHLPRMYTPVECADVWRVKPDNVPAMCRRMGIGIYGPALDRKGNSVAGIQLLERLSRALYLSIF